jgi:RNA polymerase sigma factor (sigma-70 family)
MGAPTDRELWRRAAAGEPNAFGELYDQHANAVYNFCFRRTADWALAEDLTATVFLEAWRKRRRVVFDRDDAVLPWLYGVATNVIRNETRRRRRFGRAVAGLGPQRSAPAASEQAAEEAEMRRVLESIGELPRRELDVVVLCVFAELSYEQAASRSGSLSAPSVRGSPARGAVSGNFHGRRDMDREMKLPVFRELAADRRLEQRRMLVARAGRRPRRRLMVPVAVGLTVLAAAPTLAFQRQLVDFFAGEPAPAKIQLDFESMRKHSAEASARLGAPQYTPVGLAREVMTVMLDGEMRPLWVVPTEQGAFCYRLHFHGSCLAPEDAAGPLRIGGGGLMTGATDGLDWAVGPVLEPKAQRLELLYQDGERVVIPFVWVSPPIDAGFYAYDVPPEHEQAGRLAAVVIAVDAGGEPVAHTCLPFPRDELAQSVPEVRALCERPQPAGRSRP